MMKQILIVVLSLFLLLRTSNTFSREHKILVLPSGGATGIIQATILQHLESDVSARIYEMFDEVWSSSMGSIIAALLVQPNPYSASEVKAFIEKTFSRYHSAYRIRTQLRRKIKPKTTLRETLIPLKIQSARVLSWKYGYWPKKTELFRFSSSESPNVSLAEAVASSSTVFPIHFQTERIERGLDEQSYFIDAGSEVCTQNSMNPLTEMLPEYLKNSDTTDDTLSIYFISNGWVRLPKRFGPCHTERVQRLNLPPILIKIYNIDIDLKPAFNRWKHESYSGYFIQGTAPFFGKEYLLANLAGSGMLPFTHLKEIADRTINQSKIYHDVVKEFQVTKQQEDKI